jgi:hypothetical protein
MADPLTAFAAAGNVLQFLELGTKIVSKAYKYHKAADGALSAHIELGQLTANLIELNLALDQSLAQSASSNTVSTAQDRLRDANQHCLRLSREFISEVDNLKMQDGGSSLGMAFKAIRRRGKFDARLQAVEQARSQLQVSFLLYMK